MSHSVARVAIHLTFSTKHRQPLLPKPIRSELNAYIVGILRNLDSPSIRTNSVDNHAHSLFMLSRRHALDYVVCEVKDGTSKWLKTKGPEFAECYWQTGYAVFSVGQTGIDRLITYIDRQEEHHLTVTYEDEIRRMCRQYGLTLDEGRFFE